jgi:hypothetical protein
MHMDMEQCTCEHGAGVWWGPRGRLFMFLHGIHGKPIMS